MPAKTEPRNGILHTWDLGENGWNTGMDANLLKIGLVGMHLSVKDRNLSAPPATPTDGDSYIVGPTATGVWVGLENRVVVWDVDVSPSPAWRNYVPRAGWVCFVEDEDVIYIFKTSSWEAYSPGSGHVIEDSAVAMTTRSALNFVGFDVSDDAGNDATIVTAPTTMTGDVLVPEVSEKVSFTPSFVDSWTNVTWTGQKSRIGNFLHLELSGALTGTPVGTNLTLTLPDSLAVDETIFTESASALRFVEGELTLYDADAVIQYIGKFAFVSSTTLRFMGVLDVTTYEEANSISPTMPMTFAVSDLISAKIRIPISGWNTSKTLNIGAIPAMFSGRMSVATPYAATASAWTTLGFDTEDYDDSTTVAIATDRATCPAGCNRVSISSFINLDNAGGIALEGRIFKGGTTEVAAFNNAAVIDNRGTLSYEGACSVGEFFTTDYYSGSIDNISGFMAVRFWNSNAPSASQHTLLIAASDEINNLAVGTAKTTFRMPHDFILTEVRASVNTAPTGANLIVDVKKNGVSIFTTNLLSIDATEKTSKTAATPPNITTSSLTDDDEMTIDITQVGSTVAGKGLKVALIGY